MNSDRGKSGNGEWLHGKIQVWYIKKFWIVFNNHHLNKENDIQHDFFYFNLNILLSEYKNINFY